jgi:hypothetical protein
MIGDSGESCAGSVDGTASISVLQPSSVMFAVLSSMKP